MPSIPDNIQQEIVKLVPSSIVNEISCFVFFDSHPRDRKLIDIAICTEFGEIKEYFQRDLVSSLHLDIARPTEIITVRNDNAEPFYLVLGEDQLLMISSGENLRINKRFKNVNRFEIEDTMCSGRACLKVYLKEDAVPLIFDENFEKVEEICNGNFGDDSAPIITELMRKLTEAKYNVKCNEKMYEKLKNLRQVALFSKYRKIHVNSEEAVYKNDLNEIASAMKIDILEPWIKICNKKIVIVFHVTNMDEEQLKGVQVLLHGTTRPSITYTTKIFEVTNKSPFYIESKTHSLRPNIKTAIAVIVDINELKYNVLNKILFDAIIMFQKNKEEFLLPFKTVTISSHDTLEEDFDVLHNKAIDDTRTILAILATGERTNLQLRHIKSNDETDIKIQDIFCKFLNMEQVPNMNNIFIHKISPYHSLHGVMVLEDTEDLRSDYNISVFSRLPSQVILLIHFIQDTVPAKIVITTPNLKIEAITDEFCQYNEDVSTIYSIPNYTEYAASILRRTSTLLEYLDTMMMKMNSNRNPAVQNKIGKEIHLFANGVGSFVEFRNQVLKEAEKGVNELMKFGTFSKEVCEPMVID